MNKDTISYQNTQSEFSDKIRRRCRISVSQFGGIRKFTTRIGENESLWQNRLTEGRVVGFDVAWMHKVLFVTEDPKILVPFFIRGERISIASITKLCNRLDYAVLPASFKCSEDYDDSTCVDVQNLLKASQKLLRRGKK